MIREISIYGIQITDGQDGWLLGWNMKMMITATFHSLRRMTDSEETFHENSFLLKLEYIPGLVSDSKILFQRKKKHLPNWFGD